MDTRREVAKIAGVSHDTIYKAKVIASEAPEATKEELRRGDQTIGGVYKQLRPKNSARRTRRPDFTKTSSRASTPIRGHSTDDLPIPVSLSHDPRVAAEALLYAVGRDFLQRLNVEITELLARPAKPEPSIDAALNSIVQQLNNEPVVSTTTTADVITNATDTSTVSVVEVV